MSAIREYARVPVWVVENHNEVLEPIYRAIATRHLPFEGLAMLHFDSHPDLQIDTHMSADTVFDKQLLLDTLSIENWIMPAIYAGHLGHVTWVKPPWADQLPEGSRKFKVGKDRTSGKLRVNWPDSYFVSDLLFASDEQMDNTKDATINVVTMETECLKTRDFSTSTSVSTLAQSKPMENEDCSSRQPTCHADDNVQGSTPALVSEISNKECDNVTEPNEDSGVSERTSSPTQMTRSPEKCPLSFSENSQPLLQGNEQCTSDIGEDLMLVQRNCQITGSSENQLKEKELQECDGSEVANLRRTTDHEHTVDSYSSRSIPLKHDSSRDAQQRLCNPDNNSRNITNKNGSPDCVANSESQVNHQQGIRTAYPATKDGLVQVFSEFNRRFILDIDLDFFSTRNPFKQMYTEEQYSMMNELYRFAAPLDESPQSIEACQKVRGEQISELSVCLKAAFSGQAYDASLGVQQDRFTKVVKLVRSLQSTPGIEEECLDPEMVHMAGLTCDDHGELPHHVSTDEEIVSLISEMEELLAEMPTPTMVTISRSSHDDYCPADQVDGIQQKVLSMLQSLYSKLDVHLEYESN